MRALLNRWLCYVWGPKTRKDGTSRHCHRCLVAIRTCWACHEPAHAEQDCAYCAAPDINTWEEHA